MSVPGTDTCCKALKTLVLLMISMAVVKARGGSCWRDSMGVGADSIGSEEVVSLRRVSKKLKLKLLI